jgi:hypothetical protein
MAQVVSLVPDRWREKKKSIIPTLTSTQPIALPLAKRRRSGARQPRGGESKKHKETQKVNMVPISTVTKNPCFYEPHKYRRSTSFKSGQHYVRLDS